MVKVHLRISPDTFILHRNMSPLRHSPKLARLAFAANCTSTIPPLATRRKVTHP